MDGLVQGALQALGRFESFNQEQAARIVNDQCAPANPRMPMIDDMRQLMRQAYHGNAEGAPTGKD
ncbi:hypothetical protein [Streptomyces subrutilus]|uniref:Alcohol dehydrogenase iron-type/glycerol dehydrogenase GldA domain-containing protein n=1 Tax=Streptomyces subrutilus TaxID=36818 RepID=A0A1E5PP50_9ACTN|nr:hypothetical protein [Streptomyces subrutilus]OEJ31341.1 hypothetical protein BGK67_08270 [Streptomyces subrutilus]